MSRFIVTLDLDWACEAAIEEALDFFEDRKVAVTVFTTHRSKAVERRMDVLDVGLHPYFGSDSSHGSTIPEVVQHILGLPHNLAAFRCHRFGSCNLSRQAMMEAGMHISSNVCTDLETVVPFKDRFGLLEIPIFFEDGGYLWRKHSLEMNLNLQQSLEKPGIKVLLVHPMHLALNTPRFEYMAEIKSSLSRQAWNQLSLAMLNQHRWKGRGIKDLLIDIFQVVPQNLSLKSFAGNFVKIA